MDMNDIMKSLGGIEQKLAAFEEQAKKEIGTVGAMSTETKNAIEAISIKQREFADELLALKQRGALPQNETKADGWGDQFVKADAYKSFVGGQTQPGPQIAGHTRFARRVNAGFMQVLSRGHIRLRVYERGAGETPAPKPVTPPAPAPTLSGGFIPLEPVPAPAAPAPAEPARSLDTLQPGPPLPTPAPAPAPTFTGEFIPLEPPATTAPSAPAATPADTLEPGPALPTPEPAPAPAFTGDFTPLEPVPLPTTGDPAKDAKLNLLERLRSAGQKLTRAMQREYNELKRLAAATPAAPQLDPRMAVLGAQWMKRNPWYNPRNPDADTQFVFALDQQLTAQVEDVLVGGGGGVGGHAPSAPCMRWWGRGGRLRISSGKASMSWLVLDAESRILG